MNRPTLWIARQREALAGLLAITLLGLTLACWLDPTTLPDPPGNGPRAAELSTRLDPNTADVDTLAAVPGLGEPRARAIVAYRTAFAARHGRRRPFAAPADLLPIHGIGVPTVENIKPYLTFGT